MATVKVLFDEAHSEAWTIRPELAATMQPAHPGDASYVQAAALLAGRGFDVAAHVDGVLSGDALADTDLLVIAHPSEPAWEQTTGVGSPRFSAAETEAIAAYVRGGGGLLVLGETEQEKYGNNINELLASFGVKLRNDTVQDYEHCDGAPSWILADLRRGGGRGRDGDVLARVHSACFYRTTTIETSNGARVIARTHSSASVPEAPLLVSSEHGDGRVVVLADSDLFGDDCIAALDHAALWLNVATWAARRPTDGGPAQPASGPARDLVGGVEWTTLREQTNALALLQAPDGALKEEASREQAAAYVSEITAALRALAARYSNLSVAADELEKWQREGYGKPDFSGSLDAFRPERARNDGELQVAFFPMYKQNGSPDTCFEAVALRVPWPAWIARLEATRYDNAKYVPVELLDATRGYDSECAVLFPEMVSVAERQPNHWGAIFCDRESARLRQIASQAADLLAMNLPPDAARLLMDTWVSQQAYILWDLIHDRAHSHGDLPFDPFMVRQRAPYWMYSLEELRCDLTTFGEAVELEREGLDFARNVQYAILFDRLLRFPITGTRVRNYDGLGGQLLFAYLHQGGYLTWTDNQLSIDWDRVTDGVIGLRDGIFALYRSGIDRTKLQHWAAAHDLVARFVPPASGSKWVAGGRSFAEVEDPRPYCDEVLPDEFPLSIFYSALARALGPA